MRMIGVLGCALALLAAPVAAEAYDRLVNPFHNCSLSGTPEYNSLHEAVDAANPGDHIGVCPGTYDQSVVVNKAVTFTGIGVAVVDNSSGALCFDVTAADVTIRYLTIRHCDAGILVRSTAPGALIQNNHLQFNTSGISVSGQNAIVQNNLVEDGHFGIATNTISTIKNNTLRRLTIALEIQGTGAIVTKNSVQDSGAGIFVRGGSDLTIGFNSVSGGGVGIQINNMGLNNLVTRNVVTRNRSIDCVWDRSGGVTFSKNTCGTESPAGAWD